MSPLFHAIAEWNRLRGDADAISWAVAGGEAVAGLMCIAVAILSAEPGRRGWAIIGALLLLLACNKQLDLQLLLTKAAGGLTAHTAFYRHRRAIELSIAAMALLSLVWFLRWAHFRAYGLQGWIRLAECGLIMILCSSVLRMFAVGHAAGLGGEAGHQPLGWLELGGAAAAATGATLSLVTEWRSRHGGSPAP